MENVTNILSAVFADELKTIDTYEREIFGVVRKIPLACTILTAIKADAFPFCDPDWGTTPKKVDATPEKKDDHAAPITEDTPIDAITEEKPKPVEDKKAPKSPLSSDPTATIDTMSVYFGVGCFWHIQHEIVQAEKTILNRLAGHITALTGYAGSSKTGDNGLVCYHNSKRLALYGELGHGEAVNVNVPKSDYIKFA